jgi:hypothetical protein
VCLKKEKREQKNQKKALTRAGIVRDAGLSRRALINAVIAEVRPSLNISDFRQMTSKIKSGK